MFPAEGRQPAASLLCANPWYVASPLVPIQLAKGKPDFSGLSFSPVIALGKEPLCACISKQQLEAENPSAGSQDTACPTVTAG